MEKETPLQARGRRCVLSGEDEAGRRVENVGNSLFCLCPAPSSHTCPQHKGPWLSAPNARRAR